MCVLVRIEIIPRDIWPMVNEILHGESRVGVVVVLVVTIGEGVENPVDAWFGSNLLENALQVRGARFAWAHVDENPGGHGGTL